MNVEKDLTVNNLSTDQVAEHVQQLGRQARGAAKVMAMASRGQKDKALHAIANALEASVQELVTANKLDLQSARDSGLDSALLDRLELSDKGIAAMAEGCRQVASLADPVGEIADMSYRPSGIQVGKMRVPLGVIGIIYESRPNVTVDAAVLCIKSGNATILRGGSEAINSNQAIAKCIATGLASSGLPSDGVQIIETTDRAAVGEMITMSEYVDVIIPRGGKSLIERISQQAKVPVIKHLDGNCHVYIDLDADVQKAHDIALNSKTHRYGVCNAMETLLVHQAVAKKVLPKLCLAYDDSSVEMRVCAQTMEIFEKLKAGKAPGMETLGLVQATSEDWNTEYLAPVLAIRIVEGYQQAVRHIARHSSAHTESIVTENVTTARRFLAEVDSSSVMVNASTRFADGFEYGLGAEIGISTDKLHARGPVGLDGLTSQKYIVFGDGHIRQ